MTRLAQRIISDVLIFMVDVSTFTLRGGGHLQIYQNMTINKTTCLVLQNKAEC